MKASRLMSVVLLLQTHGRMTTEDLARRLEVSRRTVLRDVEALSAAGVPVHAERGRHGAIVLDRRARLDLSRLDPAEVQLLAVAGLDPDRLGLLGLAETSTRARQKLEAAARRGASEATPSLAEVLLVDRTGWFTTGQDRDLTVVLAAARDHRRIRARYRRSGEGTGQWLVLDPYGLACKGSTWYVVGDVDGSPRMLNAGRLQACEVLEERAVLRPGQTLRSVWDDLLAGFRPPAPVMVEATLRASRLDLARRILGSRLVAAGPADQGRVPITVAYPDVESVRQLLQFGDHIQVTSPAEAVERMRDLAGHLWRAHEPDPPT